MAQAASEGRISQTAPSLILNEMVAMVHELNIEHFERLLVQTIDDIQRATVTRLLAEERAKLAALHKAEKRG